MTPSVSDARVVNITFETSDYDSWDRWLRSTLPAMGQSEYRIYRDNETPSLVDLFITVDHEREGRSAAAQVLDAAAREASVTSARFVAAFRKA